MNVKSPFSITHMFAAAAAALLLTAAGPAASHDTKSKAKHGHSQGMKKSAMRTSGSCDGGGTWQDTPTCRKEAAAAKAEAQRNRLATGQDANFERNRTLRCQGLPAGDRDACVARMAQPSDVSGSVTEGGILYEATQTVPAGTAGSMPMKDAMPQNSMQPRRSMPQQRSKAMPKQPPLN